jgi:hypothetical protein
MVCRLFEINLFLAYTQDNLNLYLIILWYIANYSKFFNIPIKKFILALL